MAESNLANVTMYVHYNNPVRLLLLCSDTLGIKELCGGYIEPDCFGCHGHGLSFPI